MNDLPATVRKPRRFDTGADEESRSKILAAIETFPAEKQLAVACSFTLVALAGMRDNAPGPAQRRICQTHMDILEGLIPAEIHAIFAKVGQQ